MEIMAILFLNILLLNNYLYFSVYFSEEMYLYMYIINIIPSHTKNLNQTLTNFQCYLFTFAHSLGTQVIVREATIFREAAIFREATFLEAHVSIKANYPITKLRFALPQTILK